MKRKKPQLTKKLYVQNHKRSKILKVEFKNYLKKRGKTEKPNQY